ncbi:MAG: SpoIIE family protein phosphatase, partial [Acidobacteriales bacterium]|nr:SpoIIE family protein phosphatase [Terriglobales bacterium]
MSITQTYWHTSDAGDPVSMAKRVMILLGLAVAGGLTGLGAAFAAARWTPRYALPTTVLLVSLAVVFFVLFNASVARSLQQGQELRRDLLAAQELQRSLLPTSMPVVQGIEIAAACRMARMIGGDHFDAIELGPGRVLLVVADVSVKGSAAALAMAAFHALVRTFAMEGKSPAEIARRVHAQQQAG